MFVSEHGHQHPDDNGRRWSHRTVRRYHDGNKLGMFDFAHARIIAPSLPPPLSCFPNVAARLEFWFDLDLKVLKRLVSQYRFDEIFPHKNVERCRFLCRRRDMAVFHQSRAQSELCGKHLSLGLPMCDCREAALRARDTSNDLPHIKWMVANTTANYNEAPRHLTLWRSNPK